MSQRTLRDYALAGLWALPIFGLANFIGTLWSQPDYNRDFPTYARYVHTPGFLASHFATSMLGTGIGLLGKAFLADHRDVIALNSSVYGTALDVTVGVGLALFVIGVALFAVAISRSQSLPTAAGVLLAVSIPVFSIGSIMGNLLAQIGAVLLIGSTIRIARSASKTRTTPKTTGVIVDQEPPLIAT